MVNHLISGLALCCILAMPAAARAQSGSVGPAVGYGSMVGRSIAPGPISPLAIPPVITPGSADPATRNPDPQQPAAFPYGSYPLIAVPYYPFVPVLPAERAAPAGASPSTDLRRQIDRLSEEVDKLRTERRRPARPQPPAEPAPAPAKIDQPAAPDPPALLPAVLVLRDGRRIDAESYAIIGNTLLVFTGSISEKYALDSIDLDRTEQVNAQRGVRFFRP